MSKIIYLLFIVFFILSCKEVWHDEKPAFGSYGVEEVIELQRDIWHFARVHGREKGIARIDSLLEITDKKDDNLRYFLTALKIREETFLKKNIRMA